MDYSRPSDEQLLALLRRAVILLDKPGWTDRADEAIQEIQAEFLHRQKLHLHSEYTPMLGALGYTVKQRSLNQTERRKLLVWIVDGPLPLINDERYTVAWGEPGSLSRIRRMYADISLYSRRYGSGPGMEMAKARWQADMEFLQHLASERFPESAVRA